jgi:hypothetical protein
VAAGVAEAEGAVVPDPAPVAGAVVVAVVAAGLVVAGVDAAVVVGAVVGGDELANVIVAMALSPAASP